MQYRLLQTNIIFFLRQNKLKPAQRIRTNWLQMCCKMSGVWMSDALLTMEITNPRRQHVIERENDSWLISADELYTMHVAVIQYVFASWCTDACPLNYKASEQATKMKRKQTQIAARNCWIEYTLYIIPHGSRSKGGHALAKCVSISSEMPINSALFLHCNDFIRGAK